MYTVRAVLIKEKILDSAKQLYAEQGYSGFSMRKVAKRAGISTMATYRHFENKDQLLHHVVVHGFKLFIAYLQRPNPDDEPWARLDQQNIAYREFAEDHVAFYEIMFLSTDEVSQLRVMTPDNAKILKGSFLILRQRMVDLGVPETEATAEAVRMWSIAHGLISLNLSGRLAFLDGDFPAFYLRQTREHLDQLRERLERTGRD